MVKVTIGGAPVHFSTVLGTTSLGSKSLGLYANPATGNLKIGSKGKSVHVSLVYGTLSKGEARRLRKTLRAGGMPSLASQPRTVYQAD